MTAPAAKKKIPKAKATPSPIKPLLTKTGKPSRAAKSAKRKEEYARLQAAIRSPKKVAPKTKQPRARVKDGDHQRTVTFTDDEIHQAFDIMAIDGVSLREACLELSLTYRSVLSRINATPSLEVAHARARQSYVRTQARRMNEIATEEPDVQRARLKCDNIKWEAARVIPKEYGDRVALTGEGGGPIQSQTTVIDPAKLGKLTDAQLAAAIEAAKLLVPPTADE